MSAPQEQEPTILGAHKPPGLLTRLAGCFVTTDDAINSPSSKSSNPLWVETQVSDFPPNLYVFTILRLVVHFKGFNKYPSFKTRIRLLIGVGPHLVSPVPRPLQEGPGTPAGDATQPAGDGATPTASRQAPSRGIGGLGGLLK